VIEYLYMYVPQPSRFGWDSVDDKSDKSNRDDRDIGYRDIKIIDIYDYEEKEDNIIMIDMS